MDDDAIAQFTSITSADPERARQYLQISDGDMEQAIQLYFENGGSDLSGGFGAQPSAQQPSALTVPTSSRPIPTAGHTAGEPIRVDADDESEGGGVNINNRQGATADDDEALARRMQADVDEDEAMARRLQEESYQEGGVGRGVAEGMDIDPETGVRRPVARTRDTLAAPSMGGGFGYDDEDDLQAVREQLAMRNRMGRSRPGIFNQRPPPQASNSVWEDQEDPSRQQNLSRATGGASDTTSKSNRLAEMYRPPFELMSDTVSWDGLRAEGKEAEKWILLNVQDPNVFDCQVLNRDIWKNEEIKATVKESFIFKQYTKDDPQAQKYVQYYFKQVHSQDAYPHIAIVDPRTGEQVKVWSGAPAPKPVDFLTQLHEFLDRYSLKANSRNPVAKRKAEKKPVDVDRMTEDEMLQMAMQNSMDAGKKGPKSDDPDTLTRQQEAKMQKENEATNGDAGLSKATKTTSPFDAISSSTPHEEPAANVPNTTRIQFRHPGGRVIRRFAMDDKVRRIFEWLKASPLEGHEGKAFELVFMGKNLMESIDMSIEEAGLKNGSVMVEFIEE